MAYAFQAVRWLAPWRRAFKTFCQRGCVGCVCRCLEFVMARWSTTKEGRQYWHDLSSVTTPSEASRLWGVPARTLIMWCNEGKVAAVQPEGCRTWLISVRHMIALRGEPDVTKNDCVKTRDLSPEV